MKKSKFSESQIVGILKEVELGAKVGETCRRLQNLPLAAKETVTTNALAETTNGLYKTELRHRRAPWKTRESVELTTLQWVHWFNHTRLLGPIGYLPPSEAEANYYRQLKLQTESAVST